MRIILEPTADQAEFTDYIKQHRVVLDHPSDELDIWGVASLLAQALVGYGYHPNNVDDVINSPDGRWTKEERDE